MAIGNNRIWQIANSSRKWGLSGKMITLGVQDLIGTNELWSKILGEHGFKYDGFGHPLFACGYSVESLDLSDFEGADHIFDLNQREVPDELKGQYDVVYTGGTIEHVFDIRQTLKNIFELLKPKGVIIHTGPTNGWVEHGFYQFSPTFFTDYYSANFFEILEVNLMEAADDGGQIVHSYVPGIYDGAPAGSLNGLWNFYVVVRKTVDSTWERIPTQRFYENVHSGTAKETSFGYLDFALPFLLVNGERQQISMTEIPLLTLTQGEGFELMAKLENYSYLSQSETGKISPVFLKEDGKLIGPANTLRDDIIKYGKGRFLQWGEWILFSTSDGLPPAGRVYSCLIPNTQINKS